MYIPATGQIIVEIPKTATRTLKEIALRVHGNIEATGHRRASQLVAWCDLTGRHWTEILAVWRDPLDKFTSAMNHVYGDNDKVTLRDALNRIERGANQTAFKPAGWYLDRSDIQLFPFHDLSRIAARIGWRGEIENNFASPKRWTTDDLKGWFDEHYRF